jgi:hypothetical protein
MIKIGHHRLAIGGKLATAALLASFTAFRSLPGERQARVYLADTGAPRLEAQIGF